MEGWCKLFIFENLLSNEYFPAELPPCFHTDSLADNASKIEEFIHNNECKKTSVPLTFGGYKNCKARRKFGIPNPYHYCKTAMLIADKQEEFFNIFTNSKASISAPIKGKPIKTEAYKKKAKNIRDRQIIIESTYQDNMYEIYLDIASFFDSVYTHSISWAMHSKEIAKQRRHDNELIGNVLDKRMQAMNDGQTNGLIVGNEISRIVSEIILCKIDKNIEEKLPDVKYIRYRDDYYIYIPNNHNIENIISIIRNELANYELLLNVDFLDN